MLRRIRIILAVIFLVMITLLFLDFTETVHLWFGWMAKIQFLPSLLALNVGVIILLVAYTSASALSSCTTRWNHLAADLLFHFNRGL